jgi:phosphoglycolate phosphatase
MMQFKKIGFNPKLVIFDLDGTLVDSATDIQHALNNALSELGLETVTEYDVRRWVGRGASRLVSCVLEAKHYRKELHDELLAVFMRHYQAEVCLNSQVYDGVAEFIAACQQANIKLACVTNKPYAPAKALLDALNILQPFQLLVGGDTLPHKKPHPEPFLHCLRYFQVSAKETLVLGDSRNDVEAALAAHIPCVAVSYGYNHGEPIEACKPEWIVDSLVDLI